MKKEQLQAIAVRLADSHYTKKRKELQAYTVDLMTMTASIVLSDKYNWCKDDINEFIREIDKQFILLHEKYVKVEDIRQWAKERGIGL